MPDLTIRKFPPLLRPKLNPASVREAYKPVRTFFQDPFVFNNALRIHSNTERGPYRLYLPRLNLDWFKDWSKMHGPLNLAGKDLTGANLQGAKLLGINLSKANLTRVNLSNADLYLANLIGANLEKANLDSAQLYNADLGDANLRKANLSQTVSYSANLAGADLEKANLVGAQLYNAHLKGANLRKANLSGAKLYGSNLERANLREANLSEANLYGTNLAGTDFTRANLSGANLGDNPHKPSPMLSMEGAQFHGAHVDRNTTLEKRFLLNVLGWNRVLRPPFKVKNARLPFNIKFRRGGPIQPDRVKSLTHFVSLPGVSEDVGLYGGYATAPTGKFPRLGKLSKPR